VSGLIRGRIYRTRLAGISGEKFVLVVSNNNRNRALEGVLAIRFTSTPKPLLPSIIRVPENEPLAGSSLVCDDIYEVFEAEVTADIGALTPHTMARVNNGLKAALALV